MDATDSAWFEAGQEPPLPKSQGDPIEELCDLLRENKMSVVFWVCDNPNHRGVTWEHRKDKSVATCDVCGKTSHSGGEELPVAQIATTEPEPFPVGSVAVEDEETSRRLDRMRRIARLRDAQTFGGKPT